MLLLQTGFGKQSGIHIILCKLIYPGYKITIHMFATLFQRIKFDSTYRAFGCHRSLRQYDVISRWHWILTVSILLAFPLVSNAIWRLRHNDEGCSDSRKLCKCYQTLSCEIVKLTETYL